MFHWWLHIHFVRFTWPSLDFSMACLKCKLFGDFLKVESLRNSWFTTGLLGQNTAHWVVVCNIVTMYTCMIVRGLFMQDSQRHWLSVTRRVLLRCDTAQGGALVVGGWDATVLLCCLYDVLSCRFIQASSLACFAGLCLSFFFLFGCCGDCYARLKGLADHVCPSLPDSLSILFSRLDRFGSDLAADSGERFLAGWSVWGGQFLLAFLLSPCLCGCLLWPWVLLVAICFLSSDTHPMLCWPWFDQGRFGPTLNVPHLRVVVKKINDTSFHL